MPGKKPPLDDVVLAESRVRSPWDFEGSYDNMTDPDRDQMLAETLQDRYHTTDPREINNRFAQELGIGAYKAHVRPVFHLQGADGTPDLGMYLPDRGTILYKKQSPDEEQANPYHTTATLAHETAHLADDVLDSPYAEYENQTPLHHSGLRQFEPDMAQSMATQQAMEMGVPASQDLLTKYPWLRQVNPQSSNPLASPWTGAKQDLPPEIYNDTRVPFPSAFIHR